MTKEGECVACATGCSQDLAEKISKLTGTSNKGWQKINLKVASIIQLYLADEIIYNVMNKEMAT